MDGVSGFGNLRAGGDFGCACGVGVGAFGFSGTRFGVEAVDAAFRDADFGGGYGRVGFVRHKRCRLGGLAGYAVSVDLRQCVFNLPVLVRAAYQGFLQVPEARLQTAQALGAGAWQRFLRVEWPVLRPWLAGGLCLVFLYCFSGFGLALLLGGDRYATVEVEIYRLIAYELDMAQASVLVWLVLGITAAAGLLYARLSRRTDADKAHAAPRPRKPETAAERLMVAAVLSVLCVCCLMPLLAVVRQAVLAGGSWRVLLEGETLAALWNTVRFRQQRSLPLRYWACRMPAWQGARRG